MKRIGKPGWVLLAAIASLSLGASTSLGQSRVGQDGHAMDANPRVGSGSLNDGSGNHPQPGVLGNAIVDGNVTGGQQFRGFVPYSDPGAFTGALAARPSQDLVQNGTGVTTGGTLIDNSNNVRLFYGDTRAAPPPPGFVQMGANGSYIQAPLVNPTLNDTRVGSSYTNTYFQPPLNNIMLLPGPLDSNNQQSVIAASPITGVRQLSASSAADLSYLSSAGGVQSSGNAGYQQAQNAANVTQLRAQVNQEFMNATPNTIGNLTDAQGNPLPKLGTMNTGPGVGTMNNGSGTLGNGTMGNGTMGTGSQSGNQPLNQPLNQPQNQSQSMPLGQPLDQPLDTSPTLNTGGPNSGGSRFTLVPPTRQSAQYAMLRRRLEQQLGPNANSAQIDAQIYNQQVRDRQGQQAGGLQPGAANSALTKPPGQQSGTAAQGQTATRVPGQPTPTPTTPGLPGTQQPQQAKTAPPVIDSLAAGINSKTLKQVMSDAEDEMAHGRWVAAIDQYDVAQQLAPNNPLIGLGRSYAELGASYYAQAESHLRQVLSSDQTLLMGRYDLVKMMGKDRVDYVKADLKGAASNDATSPRPVFLLAYIYYNLGDDALASGYLSLAEKRSNGDPFYKMLRTRWQLEQTAAPGQSK